MLDEEKIRNQVEKISTAPMGPRAKAAELVGLAVRNSKSIEDLRVFQGIFCATQSDAFVEEIKKGKAAVLLSILVSIDVSKFKEE